MKAPPPQAPVVVPEPPGKGPAIAPRKAPPPPFVDALSSEPPRIASRPFVDALSLEPARTTSLPKSGSTQNSVSSGASWLGSEVTEDSVLMPKGPVSANEGSEASVSGEPTTIQVSASTDPVSSPVDLRVVPEEARGESLAAENPPSATHVSADPVSFLTNVPVLSPDVTDIDPQVRSD